MTSAAPTPPHPHPSHPHTHPTPPHPHPSHPHPHSTPLTTSTRGPLRATLRPRGLSSSTAGSSTLPHTSSLTPSHPHSPHPHCTRSHSVDSIRHNRETTPTNHRPQPHSLPSNLPSTSQHLITTTRANSSTRDSQWSHGHQATMRGSNKENVPNQSSNSGGQQRGSENVGLPKPRGLGNVPFKDRTNTSSNGALVGRPDRKRVVGKGSSLSELAPPLNAARLRPIQQSTRTATVSSNTRNTVYPGTFASETCEL